MLVNKLEEAEQIVANNKSLRWVGWDIVHREKTNKAITNKNGSFLNNSWGIDTVYPITEKGWYLPNKYRA